MAKKEKKEKKEITYSFYVGDKKVDTLTQEQCDRMCQKLSEVMSLYYSQHPEEFEAL